MNGSVTDRQTDRQDNPSSSPFSAACHPLKLSPQASCQTMKFPRWITPTSQRFRLEWKSFTLLQIKLFACCYSVKKKKVAVAFEVFKALTVRGPGHTSSSQQLVHMFLHKDLRMTVGRTGVNIMFGVCQNEAVCRSRGSFEWKLLCSFLFTCSLVDRIRTLYRITQF